MKRITIKDSNGCIDCGGTRAELGQEEYRKRYATRSIQAAIKLCRLEDAEEELKTDFLILAKAKMDGIYRKMADGIEFYPHYVLSVYIDHIMINTSGKQLYPFEYGKTWALTKKELL